jgi:hypothetical protein
MLKVLYGDSHPLDFDDCLFETPNTSGIVCNCSNPLLVDELFIIPPVLESLVHIPVLRIYRVSHARCNTARHERGCAACHGVSKARQL